MLWQRNNDWTGSEIEDSFVMVNIESGKFVALNVTATAVWDALAEPCSAGDIVDRLQRRFDVAPAECASAVDALLLQMRERSMVVPV
jgi:hypothetical protein